MKILAIRGRNLAAIAGEFAVELDALPLADAGIFAIVGPTGAGKSTLLDALCLALFDRTPRLSDRGGVPVGLDGESDALRLKSHDVRSILRKGTGVGYAEVDFLGTDRRRYRARWSVRRAREKVDGAFQPQSLDLRDLTTQASLGGTKTEVLAAIETRLGLSFDQFRRSVLLAQGDFAAFLLANQADRAALLEQMTGSEIYSRISIAASERARDATTRARLLEARLGDCEVLGPEAHQELVDEVSRASADVDERRRQVLALGATLSWHRTRRVLTDDVANAETEARAASAAWDASASEREQLALVQRARPLEPCVRDADAAILAAQAADLELQQSTAADLACERIEAASKSLLDAAVLAVAAHFADSRAREPEVAAARLLDAERVATEAQLVAARATARDSRAAAVVSSAALGSLSREHESAAREHAGAETELTQRTAHRVLADGWDRWRVELRRHGKAMSDLARVDRADLLASVEIAKQAGSAAELAHAASAEELASSTSVLESAELALATFDTPALRQERAAIDTRKQQLQSVRVALAEARRHRESAIAARSESVQLFSLATQALEGAEIARAEAGREEIRLEETRRSVDLSRTALALADRRAALRPDEACPLCGSLDHPWRDGTSPDPPVVTALEARVRELESTYADALKREASERARHQLLKARSDAEARRAEADERECSAATARHDVLAESLALVTGEAALEGPASAPWIDDALARVDVAEGVLQTRLTLADAASQSLAKARRARDAALVRADLQRQARDTASRVLEHASRALLDGDRAQSEANEARRAAEEELAPAFARLPGWQAALTKDGSSFVERCELEVDALRRSADAYRRAGEAMAVLAPKLQGAEAAAHANAMRAESDQGAVDSLEQSLQAQHTRRAALIGGEPTASFEARVRSEGERLRVAEATARSEFDEARVAHAAASARCDIARTAKATADRVSVARVSVRDSALATEPLDLSRVKELLSIDAGSVAVRSAAILALSRACERTKIVVGERTAKLALHEATEPAGLDEAFVVDAIEVAKGALTIAETAWFTQKHRLESDDEGRARHGERGVELQEHLSATQVWMSMNELIGSADGKKFSVFAQSLTFDALLAQANCHLREIGRRYSLMRVPGSDLELQVIDHDMADEVRAVTSLSGGESFLVSLSLALGLSTIGGQRTNVETLFIDEGFGTLDPETLEVAIASLEALQATGRQIGVISHVAGLADRFGARIRLDRRGPGRSAVVVER